MTNSPTVHLSEEDRQRAADGTLEPADGARVQAHLAACGACSDDVAVLTALVRRLETAGAPPADTPALDRMWPAIRERVDGAKVVPLDSSASRVRLPELRLDPWTIGMIAAVAAITTVTVIRIVPQRLGPAASAVASAPDSVIKLADDSVRMYQEQVERLLDDVRLERDNLIPETRASVDEDLETVDRAIAELQAAIARDPKNPTLRTMLASSYRQKIDLLKRIPNAG